VDPVGGGFGGDKIDKAKGLQVAQIGAPVTLGEKAQKELASGPRSQYDQTFGLGLEHYLGLYKPLVLIAVGQDWREVRTLPSSMRRDKDVIMAAVRRSPKALLFAEGPVKFDKAVLMQAIETDWKVANGIIRNVIDSHDKDVLVELATRKQKEDGLRP
jgi:hypothetical protein